jgi:hypothetical protein
MPVAQPSDLRKRGGRDRPSVSIIKNLRRTHALGRPVLFCLGAPSHFPKAKQKAPKKVRLPFFRRHTKA